MIISTILKADQTVKQTYDYYYSNNKKNPLFLKCNLGSRDDITNKLVDIILAYELSSGFEKSALGQRKITHLLNA